MTTVIEQFDAVKITNASVQFIENGIPKLGTPFGCVGTIEGETELREFIKKCEGVETDKITKPLKMTLTISGHIPVKVARDIFGLSDKDLKPGVWAYGSKSKGKKFVWTADVIDEFQDVTKLIAFPNCVSNTGFKVMIENGADELAELETEVTVMQDSKGNFYYEAITSELSDLTIVEKWHTEFKTELVAAIPTP